MHNIIKVFLTLALLSILIFAYGCDSKGKAREAEDKIILDVDVDEATEGKLSEVLKYTGILQPIKSVDLGPQMGGIVEKLYVSKGEQVKKGALLVKMNPSQLKQAEAQYAAIEKEWERLQTLHEKGAITQQQYDQVQAAYETAKAAYTLASDNTKIYAPFSGIVENISKEENEVFMALGFGAGGSGIITLVNIDTMELDIHVSDKNINKVYVGQKVYITVDTYSDSVFNGVVSNKKSVADRLSGTFEVTLKVPNTNKILESGIVAKADVVIAEKENAIIIPQEAVVSDTLAFVVKDNFIKQRNIKLGIQTEKKAEVTSGLNPGDLVVVKGVTGLIDGLEVRINRNYSSSVNQGVSK
ncbi:efflux RND transporter periplasmic adaptor subunit [bacterium]|nr:efflux RND transporter periplasmic adaptor subunit [bacterium]